MAQREDVVVDGHVDAEEFQVGFHVSVETADLGSQVDNMSWSMLLKDLKCTKLTTIMAQFQR